MPKELSIKHKFDESGLDFSLRIEKELGIESVEIQSYITKKFSEETLNTLMICKVGDFEVEWEQVLSDYNIELEYDG